MQGSRETEFFSLNTAKSPLCQTCFYFDSVEMSCSLHKERTIHDTCSDWKEKLLKKKYNCSLSELTQVITSMRNLADRMRDTGEVLFNIKYEDASLSINRQRNNYLDIINASFGVDVSDNQAFFLNYLSTLEPFMFLEKIALCDDSLGENAYGYVFLYPCMPGSIYIKLCFSQNGRLCLVSYHKEHTRIIDYKRALNKISSSLGYPGKVVTLHSSLYLALGSSVFELDCFESENNVFTCDLQRFLKLLLHETVSAVESICLDLIYGYEGIQFDQKRSDTALADRFAYVLPITTALMGSCFDDNITTYGKAIALYGLFSVWQTEYTLSLLTQTLDKLELKPTPNLFLDSSSGEVFDVISELIAEEDELHEGS